MLVYFLHELMSLVYISIPLESWTKEFWCFQPTGVLKDGPRWVVAHEDNFLITQKSFYGAKNVIFWVYNLSKQKIFKNSFTTFSFDTYIYICFDISCGFQTSILSTYHQNSSFIQLMALRVVFRNKRKVFVS